MKLVNTMGKIGTAVLISMGLAATAQAGQKVCVYDLLGTSGDLFNMAKDYVCPQVNPLPHKRGKGIPESEGRGCLVTVPPASGDHFRKLSASMSAPALSSQNLPSELMGVRVPVAWVHIRSEMFCSWAWAMASIRR